MYRGRKSFQQFADFHEAVEMAFDNLDRLSPG